MATAPRRREADVDGGYAQRLKNSACSWAGRALVDLSDAAGPTIARAEHFARLFDARLHVLHVVEPLPIIPDTPLQFNDDEVYRRSEEHLERYIWPRIEYPGTTRSLRRGTPLATITAEVADRGAEVVVLGSHGKGWVDRMLIGSVTEQVLSALPCSVLVVPVMGSGGAKARSERPPVLEATLGTGDAAQVR